MNKEIVYIGVDVDDNAFHATAVFPKSGEIVEIKSKPTFQGLKNKIGDLASRTSSKVPTCSN